MHRALCIFHDEQLDTCIRSCLWTQKLGLFTDQRADRNSVKSFRAFAAAQKFS